MLTENNFDAPKADAFLDSLEGLLTGFDPTSLTYVDGQGEWKRCPLTIRDRISNELLFRIWEVNTSGNDPAPIRNLFSPLLQNKKYWTLARMLSRKSRLSRGDSRELDDPLTVLELLILSIEYLVYRRNGGVYVADWDSRGKARAHQYFEKSERLLAELRCRLARRTSDAVSGFDPDAKARPGSDADTGPGRGLESFLELNGLLKADENGLFNITVFLIAEEEKVRDGLRCLFADLKDSRQSDEIRDFISEQLNVTKGAVAGLPQILLRTCIEILMNPDIEVSTGMQFEASGILGKLKDIRSTDALLAALDAYNLGYVDLRANLIYALGNLRQKKALASLARVLEGPDSVRVRPRAGSEYDQSLRTDKCEAVWALGKLGADAIDAMPALVRYAGTGDRETRLYLAWAMGMIGDSQKEKYGGIDASVVTALMNLLTTKQSGLFEEAAFALKKLGLPDFLHTLYLHDLATVPILSLKPSSTGLYELSETLLHLVSIKKPVVMAVTGDSGTGKTYFCQTIANGFSGIKGHEILYLMRDRVGDSALDRILGIKWLKKHATAQFCEGYPLSEDEDNPDEYFDQFVHQHTEKKLIILDGWRDQAYFHQIVKTFYENGFLDVLVKFQTTFSTRRLNLEEREGVLEKVKIHLPLIEDPAIEETPFYKEGAVLIYNLDNSIPSRLTRAEILQVFEKKKIDTWADQIRIGRFTRGLRPLQMREEVLHSHVEDVVSEPREILLEEPVPFSPSEATFSRVLNDSLELHPNLLQFVRLDSIALNRATFYTHGQIACCGYDGNIAILTGLNDRILSAHIHDSEVVDLTVVGGDIYSADKHGTLKITSFYKNSTANVGRTDSPIVSLASHRDSHIATGHLDGTVRFWDTRAGTMTSLRAHAGPVLSIAIDRQCRVYSGGEDAKLNVWDVAAKRTRVFEGHKSPISAISIYPDGRIVTGTRCDDGFENSDLTRGAKIRMLDTGTGDCKTFDVHEGVTINTINVYFDGRLFLGLRRPHDDNDDRPRPASAQTDGPLDKTRARQVSVATPAEQTLPGSVIVSDPRPGFCYSNSLEGHRLETRDCVTMGPRLITCGSESKTEHTLRIWGTVAYVEMEYEKSLLMPEATSRPPYYRSLF